MKNLLILVLLLAQQALAQSFPSKPVRIVVPFPRGRHRRGGAHGGAEMQEILGQTVLVENRAGAGGNIGTEFVAKSPADGYTLLVASAATAINHPGEESGWDLTRTSAPVVLLVLNQSLLAAHPSVPVSNVRELVALAKAKPGQVTFASYGNGSSAHLIGELFKMMAGVDLLHIP